MTLRIKYTLLKCGWNPYRQTMLWHRRGCEHLLFALAVFILYSLGNSLSLHLSCCSQCGLSELTTSFASQGENADWLKSISTLIPTSGKYTQFKLISFGGTSAGYFRTVALSLLYVWWCEDRGCHSHFVNSKVGGAWGWLIHQILPSDTAEIATGDSMWVLNQTWLNAKSTLTVQLRKPINYTYKLSLRLSQHELSYSQHYFK